MLRATAISFGADSSTADKRAKRLLKGGPAAMMKSLLGRKSLFLLLFVFGDDARPHRPAAIKTMDKATEEIRLRGLFLFHWFDHFERRPNIGKGIDGKEVVHGNDWLEIE